MVMGVLASGNAFVGHSTNRANLHKNTAFKSYSFATCPRADRPAKLRQQMNIAGRVRRTRLAGRPNKKRRLGTAYGVPALAGRAPPLKVSLNILWIQRHAAFYRLKPGLHTRRLRSARIKNAMSPLRIRRAESRGGKLESQIQDAGDPRDSGRRRTTPGCQSASSSVEHLIPRSLAPCLLPHWRYCEAHRHSAARRPASTCLASPSTSG